MSYTRKNREEKYPRSMFHTGWTEGRKTHIDKTEACVWRYGYCEPSCAGELEILLTGPSVLWTAVKGTSGEEKHPQQAEGQRCYDVPCSSEGVNVRPPSATNLLCR